MLKLIDVEYSIGERILFSAVSLNINESDRFGLVGANGTGKTTLLRIIKGDFAQSRGRVERIKGLSIGYLPQEEIVLRGNRLIDEVLKDHNIRLADIARLRTALSAQPRSKELMRKLEHAEDKFNRLGGYEYENEAQRILYGLGFGAADIVKPVQQFSSGWQMRIVLARMLLARPDLLLLDEPTNHLDIESIEWLESYLQKFKGAMIIVSHDRYFLDKVLPLAQGVFGILEIDFGLFRKYRTNYSGYLQESLQRKQYLLQKAKNQQKEIAEIKEFIARNRANKSKAGIVKSREKYLERMNRIQVEQERKKIKVRFPVEEVFSKKLVALSKIKKLYENNSVFDDLDLVINRGDKIALIGKNGAGKSTLCRIISGREKPTSGSIWVSEKVKVNTFSHEIMLGLDPQKNVIETVTEYLPVDIVQNIRGFLGLFLFSGDDVFKEVRVLSGGEKTRLVILKAMLVPSNLLILDEPTFHLDLDSIDAIRNAIEQYPGTVILVTHDRDMIASFANRIVELKDRKLSDFPGDYKYYLWKRNTVNKKERVTKQKSRTEETPEERIKKQIMLKEERRQKLHQIFSKAGISKNPARSKKLFKEYQRLAVEIEELEKELNAKID